MEVSIHKDGEHGTESLSYLEDASGQRYYEKINHHYFHRHGDHVDGVLVGQNIEKGEGYLIAYHDDQYFPGVYKKGNEVKAEAMGPKAFGTLFFFITGFHGFHVFSLA